MNSLSCCHTDDLFGYPFCWSSCLLFDGSKEAYICQMLSDRDIFTLLSVIMSPLVSPCP